MSCLTHHICDCLEEKMKKLETIAIAAFTLYEHLCDQTYGKELKRKIDKLGEAFKPELTQELRNEQLHLS